MADILKFTKRLLRFDEGDARFELSETESGAPRSFSGGFTDGRRAERAQDAVRRSRPGMRQSIPKRLKAVKAYLEADFHAEVNGDLTIRSFETGSGHRLMLAYMNGMADDGKINGSILKPLMEYRGGGKTLDLLEKRAVEIGETKTEKSLSAAERAVTEGMTALFSEGESVCLVLETRGFEKRGVEKAENESIVLGPKEGFTESLRTNITLIRRAIRSEDLVADIRPSKGENRVSVALVYRRGLVSESLLNEIDSRLERISKAPVFSSGIAEQLMEDRSLLPLPRMLSTERPDRAASHILGGRVCLLIEGSPFAAVLPITLFSLMTSPEDVYMRPPLGTLIRLVRYIGALASVLMPGYFLALALYHQGMLTTEVLSTVIASRKMVFEPIAVEMILLLFIFQMIREAGLRVPGSIGQAIGIIGGLIMGQAAVTAHLASSVILIIVAASGLGNFCIPDYSTQTAASYFRLALVIAAWLGGLAALTSAVFITVCLLADMKSFGMPYLAPFAPKAYSKRPSVLRGRIGRAFMPDDETNTAADRYV